MSHIPVLLQTAIDLLNVKPNNIHVDCTLGHGGHAKEIIKRLEGKGKLICIDQDEDAIGYVQISDSEKTDCEEPAKSSFSRYVVYQKAADTSEMNYKWDCGDAQEKNFCSLKKKDNYNKEGCLSIKMGSKKEVLNDVIKINYTWCWEKSETNEITEDTAKTHKRD